MNNLVLGVDIGGSHITAALVDIANGLLLKETLVRAPVDSDGTREQIIDAWLTAMQQSLATKKNTVTSIGLAMPGPFDYENGISLIKEQNKYRALFGLNIKQLLAQNLHLKKEDIFFMNDACSFLQGEVLAGAARNKPHVIGITLGTGLGSAILYNGKTEDAELWTAPFKAGIAEDYLSTRWFQNRFFLQYGQNITGVKELVTLLNNNESIKEIFEEFGANLAFFLSGVYHKYKCDCVVIGGNISKSADLFLDSANLYLLQQSIPLEIRIGGLGETAAMIGAASWFKNTKLQKTQ